MKVRDEIVYITTRRKKLTATEHLIESLGLNKLAASKSEAVSKTAEQVLSSIWK